MHRPPRVRFLLANASHARWVERQDHDFVTLGELIPSHIHQPAHPRGSVHESMGGARHAAGHTDESGRRRDDFAREVACEINRQAADGTFERLAVVAPARFLHTLRPHLNHDASEKVVREIGKDLTKVADHDLGEWLTAPDLA